MNVGYRIHGKCNYTSFDRDYKIANPGRKKREIRGPDWWSNGRRFSEARRNVSLLAAQNGFVTLFFILIGKEATCHFPRIHIRTLGSTIGQMSIDCCLTVGIQTGRRYCHKNTGTRVQSLFLLFLLFSPFIILSRTYTKTRAVLLSYAGSFFPVFHRE